MNKLLLLTPPLLQTNTPYPATMHLVGYLESLGLGPWVEQRDLSIKVVREVLIRSGGEEVEELLELLGNAAVPIEEKRGASAYLDDLARQIQTEIDPAFGFSRYAEHLTVAVRRYGDLERLVKRRGVLDEPLEKHLEDAIKETKPSVIGVTCPFPGTLVGAFKIAAYVRAHHPKIRLALGGGYVNTELRTTGHAYVHRYFDDLQLDEGYAAMAALVKGAGSKEQGASGAVPSFVAPSYRGIDWNEYFDMAETDNPVTNLWNCGRWVKLVMARGCYWHRCAFCDVKLPYICEGSRSDPREIVDAMTENVHFVDEAMPPALIRGVCEEILRRGLKTQWWGNVRFDRSFTPELCRLMAKAGCIAVTGGLECADDRLLKLMSKGITRASATQALRAFKGAGIFVHAYLMYAFPTETEAEAYGALEFVRDLFREDLIQCAFWHRFALTVHSPIAADPTRFGLVVHRPRTNFALNELAFEEPGAPDWSRIGKVLTTALYNYLEGRGLGHTASWWRKHVPLTD